MELLCQKKKRAKITDRYPPLALSDVSDEATNSRNKEALDKELSKKKPIKFTILELMELTYGCRRDYVVNEARSVHEILEKYPALSRPDIVSVTLAIVVGAIMKKYCIADRFIPHSVQLHVTFCHVYYLFKSCHGIH